MLSTNTIGSNLLSPDGYSSAGHVRSRSIGQSPLLGTHALDANMAADAARLGILPAGLGSHGLPDHSLGLGHDEISAAYARAGVSPRFGPVDYGYDLGGLNGGGNYRNEYDLGLDGLGGVSPRSRRGSLSGGVDGLGLSNGNFGEGFGSGGLLDNRGRRDSLPFQY